jgi:hypothetical protein
MIGCVWILSFSPIKGGAVPEAKKEVARPDPFLQRVQIIQQMDAEGLSEYQSERDSELNKMKLTPETDRTSTSMPVKIDEDLSHLSQPQEITTATDGTLLADKAIRDKLMLERIIPVWSGTNWINGNNLANNGFVVTKKIEDLLASLNYFDAMSRHFSGPDGDMLGEYRGKVKIIRNHLLYLDYIVKYDKTFDIWRITGTNTPAAHTP